MTESLELTNKYQQKTDKQHILDNPDTYIGSVEKVDSFMWVLSEEKKIHLKEINYIPGLFKLFDEGIVNSRDHVVRMEQCKEENCIPVSNIEVTITEDGTITIMNDGNGIDVAEHPEYKIWIPELIFGHLRTSTNYDKTEKKIVGGKNGFGFKLVLIWSTFGSIETIDHKRGLKYSQEFSQNLDIIHPPKITKCKTKPYTKVTFKPDYQRLGLEGLTEDMMCLLKRRVLDIASITNKSVKVKLNGELIGIKNFAQYIDYYIGKKEDKQRIHEESNERWEYCISLANEFTQVSFVNGIHTSKGGKHVDYIMHQIIKKLVEYIEKKKKVKVNPSIKEQLFLFLRCDIENPSFDSQTKDYMNTPSSKFGSSCVVTDKFIEKIAKMGVMDMACNLTEIKETKIAKKSDGTKTKSIRGIPKLLDANWAGTDRSYSCSLILCEGDSAKAGIVSGLSTEDRNSIGIYPMKGKILNVRGELQKKISENKEIIEIKKILGLELNKVYTQDEVNKSLRYGKILFLVDQDLDGSHIKGLCINLFHCEWPSLLKIPGFIGFMNTPILKAKKKTEELLFYNDGEYEEWKETNPQGWNIKYYKGLGTSTGKEFKEYFQNKKIVEFQYQEETDNQMDMIFNKKRADDRKEWLKEYDRKSFLNTTHSLVSYKDFIDREFKHFSKYDCDRSIPNIMDGLKISLRKILFSAFKKNLTSEIKVAQFSGYVSEHSGYHHGEASLNGAIVGMAQNYVGSNNIHLLMPNGQFGTRLEGGKDSASERYIFTMLNPITRFIFPSADDNILTYLNDDGLYVEPIYYAPIIPMILVNGSKGIGTGFSTEILCYNPLDIIHYLQLKLSSQEPCIDFIPYYDGFTGTITKVNESKFLVKGKYEEIGTDKIKIIELPIGTWTSDYKEFLETLMDNTDKSGKKVSPLLKDVENMSTDVNVCFIIHFQKGKLEEIKKEENGIEKTFKLTCTLSTTNMHLFNSQEKLTKYNSITEIIDNFYDCRLTMYKQRKDYLLEFLRKELCILSNKAKYILEVLEGTIDLRRMKKEDIHNMLIQKKYDEIDEFKYLIKMPMDSVSEENIKRILKEKENKELELSLLMKKTIQQLWLEELEILKEKYIGFKKEKTTIITSVKVVKKPKTKK
jgi:DNA topoisomerase-2